MQPNIVIVVIDALRRDRVGSFGGRDLTPNIDTLAGEATIFPNAYSTINTTDPAVTSIQTGRYPLSHGVVNHGRRVTESEKQSVENVRQLPEILSENGYRTGKFGRPLGRWHRNGFDRYPSEMESRKAFGEQSKSTKSAIGDTLEAVHPLVKRTISNVYQSVSSFLPERGDVGSNATIDAYHRSQDQVIHNFCEWIDCSEPFFSFVHLMDTHGPYSAPPDLIAENLNTYDYKVDMGNYTGWEIPAEFHSRVLNGHYPEIREKYYFDQETPSTAIIDASYDASVAIADDRLGHLISELHSQEVYEDTLLVFLADHGESLTEHGIYYDHHGLYDSTIRIPMLIRSPNKGIDSVADLVQITDIAPTVLSIADVEEEKIEPDGFDLTPAIQGEGSIDREFVMAEEAHTQRRRMIFKNEKKLIYLVDGTTVCRYCEVEHAPSIELYDTKQDPEERTNLLSEQKDTVEKLKRLSEERSNHLLEKRPKGGSDNSVSYHDEEDVYKRLEALGYR
ncbi:MULTISPECIES: sulfatase [Haloarcula]|uniref:sulfatase family protein n=1 Tax=Haloarcula TaxID=2237 RepID=UPI0023ED4442|nr:sulfatase [Halomicroarcula sp. XH51]